VGGIVATTNNYMDRQIFGLLAPTLQKAIGWNELQYGYIITAFQAAYASRRQYCQKSQT
jgi:ACS family hexuronate transporter-like MFS transporter